MSRTLFKASTESSYKSGGMNSLRTYVQREQLQQLLVRIVISKILDIDALEGVLKTMPLYQSDDTDSTKMQSFSDQDGLRLRWRRERCKVR